MGAEEPGEGRATPGKGSREQQTPGERIVLLLLDLSRQLSSANPPARAPQPPLPPLSENLPLPEPAVLGEGP